MAQNRTLDYGAPRRSLFLNRRHVGVIPAGVYSGFEVVPTVPESLALTISAGKLITAEGVSIEETAALPGEVAIVPHETLPRIDFIVAEHVYSTSNEPQTYAVVEGTAGTPPTPPALPAGSVKLAEVYVPAAAVSLGAALIQNAPKSNADSTGLLRERLSELRASPTSESVSGLSDKVYVRGGVILASSGSSAVTVLDQESPAFSPIASGAGYERWDLVTVDDNGDVAIVAGTEDIGSGSAFPPAYPDDKQVVAEVHITEQGTAEDPVLIKSDDIRDVRFFLNMPASGTSVSVDRYDFESTAGQTVVDLPFTYTPGQNQLHGSFGGADLSVTVDFLETDGNTVTYVSPRPAGVNASFWRNSTEVGSS
ncbi:MAG: hypothetical protein ABFE07_29535 [Armatimonadia bacterium]